MSYITCLPALYLKLQTKKGTLQTVRLTGSQSPQIQYDVSHLQSVSVFHKFVHLWLLWYLLCIFMLSFHVLASYFYVSLSLVTVLTVWILLNFMIDTAPLRRSKAKKGTFSYAMKESTVKDGVNSWWFLNSLSVSHITSYSTLIYL